MKAWLPTIIVFVLGMVLVYYWPQIGDMTLGKIKAR
jgi:hypothetical protein